MRKLLISLTIFSLFCVSSCQVPAPIAQMDANISLSNDSVTNQSAFANVNFTAVTKELINNQTVLQFSNDDGYAVQFQLISSSLTAKSYKMSDGNSMSGTFNLTVNGQRHDIQVISTGQGSLEVTSVESNENGVSSMRGSFSLNVVSSGDQDETTATGAIVGVIAF